MEYEENMPSIVCEKHQLLNEFFCSKCNLMMCRSCCNDHKSICDSENKNILFKDPMDSVEAALESTLDALRKLLSGFEKGRQEIIAQMGNKESSIALQILHDSIRQAAQDLSNSKMAEKIILKNLEHNLYCFNKKELQTTKMFKKYSTLLLELKQLDIKMIKKYESKRAQDLEEIKACQEIFSDLSKKNKEYFDSRENAKQTYIFQANSILASLSQSNLSNLIPQMKSKKEQNQEIYLKNFVNKEREKIEKMLAYCNSAAKCFIFEIFPNSECACGKFLSKKLEILNAKGERKPIYRPKKCQICDKSFCKDCHPNHFCENISSLTQPNKKFIYTSSCNKDNHYLWRYEIISKKLEKLEIGVPEYGALLEYNSRIFMTGGQEKPRETREYNESTNKLQIYSDMKFGRLCHCMLSIDVNRFCVIAGELDKNPIKECEEYDIKMNKWKQMPSLNDPLIYNSINKKKVQKIQIILKSND